MMADCLITVLILSSFVLIGALISGIGYLIERIRNYEKPVKPVPPSQWKIPEDDWEDRIING